jgi:hypothetical protein
MKIMNLLEMSRFTVQIVRQGLLSAIATDCEERYMTAWVQFIFQSQNRIKTKSVKENTKFYLLHWVLQ